MKGLVRTLVLLICGCACAFAADEVIHSKWAASDSRLDTNPASSFWRSSEVTYMETDVRGKPEPKYRTELRTRWTKRNLYILFICPYEELNLKPDPNKSEETNELWNWDVAEAFIGSDFKNTRRYKEFELSPQGEWIDLDIDLDQPHHEDGWKWNSGLEVAARMLQPGSTKPHACGMGRCEFRMPRSIVVRPPWVILSASIYFAARVRLLHGSTSPGGLQSAIASTFLRGLASSNS